MKKFLLAASTIAFAAATACSADAADIALRKAAPLAPPPPSAAAVMACGMPIIISKPIRRTIPSTSGGRGGFGTVGGGCDYQFSPASGWGNWVVGVFADYDFMNLHRTLQETIVSGDAKESSAWGVGGRIGYLVTPNVFTYINGGYTETTYWFPDWHRARIVSGFIVALPLAVAAPMSTALLGLNGLWGLASWKWMFIAEAIPTVLIGVFLLFCVTDRPHLARWLNDEERSWLISTL